MINAAGKKQNAVKLFSDFGAAQTWCDENVRSVNVTDVRLATSKCDYGTTVLIAVLYNEV